MVLEGEILAKQVDNVRTIRSIPLRLQGSGYPDFFEIRGVEYSFRRSTAGSKS